MEKNFTKTLSIALLLTALCTKPVAASHEIKPAGKDLLPKAKIEVNIQDERDVINQLIAVTAKNLDTQKELRDLIEEYREEQELFLKKDKGQKRHLGRMLRLSRKILFLIRQNKMEQLFSENFIQELTVLADMGSSKVG